MESSKFYKECSSIRGLRARTTQLPMQRHEKKNAYVIRQSVRCPTSLLPHHDIRICVFITSFVIFCLLGFDFTVCTNCVPLVEALLVSSHTRWRPSLKQRQCGNRGRRSCNGIQNGKFHDKLLTETLFRNFSSLLRYRSLQCVTRHKRLHTDNFLVPTGDVVSRTTDPPHRSCDSRRTPPLAVHVGSPLSRTYSDVLKEIDTLIGMSRTSLQQNCVADFLNVAGLQAEDSSRQWTWPHPLHVNTKPIRQSNSVCEIIWKGSYFRKQRVAVVICVCMYLLHFEMFHLRRFFAGETPFVAHATTNILGWTVMSRNAHKSVSLTKLVKLHVLWNTAVSRYL